MLSSYLATALTKKGAGNGKSFAAEDNQQNLNNSSSEVLPQTVD
jgi:hypothetical protein